MKNNKGIVGALIACILLAVLLTLVMFFFRGDRVPARVMENTVEYSVIPDKKPIKDYFGTPCYDEDGNEVECKG